ncbi:MAG TPA: TMEM175 family protein [Nitrospira sp.]|nr:TMEM175 family protein [Nitrospira sp.]
MLSDKFETLRIEAFSDAVFAIAITLLVLEIKVPPDDESSGGLSGALLHLWPSYLAFLTSFCTIGMMWINHHRLFTLIQTADETLIAINMVLLLFITWVPFPTAVLAAYLRHPEEWSAAVLYSGTFVMIAIIFNVLWWHGIRRGHVPHKGWASHPITRQYIQGPVLYAVMFLVGLVDGTACLILSTLLAIYFSLSPRLWERGQGRRWVSTVRHEASGIHHSGE